MAIPKQLLVVEEVPLDTPVKWFLDTMELHVQITELNFNDAGHVINNDVWSMFESEIVNRNILLKKEKIADLRKLLEGLFPETARKPNFSEYWLKICLFLDDLAMLNKELLIYFASSASNVIISLLMNATNVAEDDNIKKSLSLCIGCIDTMMCYQFPKNSNADLWFDNINEFLNIVQGNSIFLMKNSFEIFNKILPLDDKMSSKTLEIISTFLNSNNSEDKREIHKFCIEKKNLDSLQLCIVGKREKKDTVTAIQIMITLVNYGKDHNLAFECDWLKILRMIYSKNKSIQKLSIELLAAKFQNVTEHSLLDMAIQVSQYAGAYSSTDYKNFIKMLQPYEEFQDCKKLFQILGNSLEDFSKYEYIIAILAYIVEDFEAANPNGNYLQRFEDFLTQSFALLEQVQQPKMLFELFTIVDISKFRGFNSFNQDFLILETRLRNGLCVSRNYDDAVGMSRLLKKCTSDLTFWNKIFWEIFGGQFNATKAENHDNIKTTSVQLLAIDDTFNCFGKVAYSDTRKLFEYFQTCFRLCDDISDAKAPVCALNINMLTTYYLIAHEPPMSKQEIENAVAPLDQYIQRSILTDENSLLVNVVLYSAYCRLCTCIPNTVIESQVLTKIFSMLAKYSKDCYRNSEYFKLIDALWDKLCNLYQNRTGITTVPYTLFQLYETEECLGFDKAVQRFVATIWNYDKERNLFAEIMQTVVYAINVYSKSKKFLDNVLSFIMNFFALNNVNAVVMQIVIEVIIKKHGNQEIKIEFVERITKHLDTKYLTGEGRQMITTILSQRTRDISQKNIIEKFVKYFTDRNTSEGPAPSQLLTNNASLPSIL